MLQQLQPTPSSNTLCRLATAGKLGLQGSWFLYRCRFWYQIHQYVRASQLAQANQGTAGGIRQPLFVKRRLA